MCVLLLVVGYCCASIAYNRSAVNSLLSVIVDRSSDSVISFRLVSMEGENDAITTGSGQGFSARRASR